MTSSSIAASLSDISAATRWRLAEQLRGLQRSAASSSLLSESATLAQPGTALSSASLALHPSERGLAVGMNSLCSSGSIGLVPILSTATDCSIQGASTARWMDVKTEREGVYAVVSSVEWVEGLLFAGSSQGKIYVMDCGVEKALEPSGPVAPVGCLLGPMASQRPLREIVSSPSGCAVSTLVRKLKACRDVAPGQYLAGLVHNTMCVWDLNGSDAQPLTERSMGEEPVTAVAWAPGSSSVLAVGNFMGDVSLVDHRTPPTVNNNNSSSTRQWSLTTSKGWSCRDLCFSPVVPWGLATCFSNDTVHMFDCRFSSRPMFTVNVTQGGCSAVRCSSSHAELLATGGGDGTVRLWSTAAPPTHLVGSAAFRAPVVDMVTTQQFLRSRFISISCEGELSITGLKPDAASALAPTFLSVRREADSVELRQRLESFMAEMQNRSQSTAVVLAVDAATTALSRGDASTAQRIVRFALDPCDVLPLNYEASCLSRAQGIGPQEVVTHEDAVEVYRREMESLRYQVPSTVKLSELRGYVKPATELLQRLAAVRQSVCVMQAMEQKDVKGVIAETTLLIRAALALPGGIHMLDWDLLASATSFVLNNYLSASTLVDQILEALLGTAGTKGFVKRIVASVLAPLVVEGEWDGRQRRFEIPKEKPSSRRYFDQYFQRLPNARKAVAVQLEVRRLGLQHPQEIVALVTAYQQNCSDSDRGVFGWLSLQAILLYLNALFLTSNFVALFFVAARLQETLKGLPAVAEVESLLQSAVSRLVQGASKIKDSLEEIANARLVTLATVNQAETVLQRAHSFVVVVLSIVLQSEAIANDTNMDDLPTALRRALDTLNENLSALLEIWADVLAVLSDSAQRAALKGEVMESVRQFSKQMTGLSEIAPDGEEDETIQSVLEVCDDFIAALRKR